MSTDAAASVDLLWIPLGSGERVVRLSGSVFEFAAALVGRRARCALFHSALEVRLDAQRFVIEMAPVPDRHGVRRGVVAEGAVGARRLGRFRIFRYEVRCWPDGRIPDAELVGVSVRRVSDDAQRSIRRSEVVHRAGTPVLRWRLARATCPRSRHRIVAPLMSATDMRRAGHSVNVARTLGVAPDHGDPPRCERRQRT